MYQNTLLFLANSQRGPLDPITFFFLTGEQEKSNLSQIVDTLIETNMVEDETNTCVRESINLPVLPIDRFNENFQATCDG